VTNHGRAAYITGSPPPAQIGRDSTGYEAGIRLTF
jgi:hypothetical protein